MYLIATHDLLLMARSKAYALKIFHDFSLQERMFNLLLNLGFLPSYYAFDDLCDLLLKEISGASSKQLPRLAGRFYSRIQAIINHSHSNMCHSEEYINIFGDVKRPPACKTFITTVSNYLKDYKDFKMYFKVITKDNNYIIITSMDSVADLFPIRVVNISLDKRLEKLLDVFGCPKSRDPRGTWELLIKQAYHGTYSEILKDTDVMNKKPITVYKALSRSLKVMLEESEYAKDYIVSNLSLVDTRHTVLLLATFLRCNKDYIWYC